MPPPGPPPGLGPPDTEAQPGLNQAKLARQEQLVKKLSGMLMGSDEELIKSCIAELRAKHGKLSGWPTSKIATHIVDMMKENNLSSKLCVVMCVLGRNIIKISNN